MVYPDDPPMTTAFCPTTFLHCGIGSRGTRSYVNEIVIIHSDFTNFKTRVYLCWSMLNQLSRTYLTRGLEGIDSAGRFGFNVRLLPSYGNKVFIASVDS